ncbi:nucleolar 14 [Olea europaea subsp. europaea]|uniref:Nucleolar 14 n=1 Tax=Olea europaea subsp. europaea TaxID=158383 RepID=A0A8S0PH53_OLEEU|nr:nucleolar 14 [Olea europaea subsp. europaea]
MTQPNKMKALKALVNKNTSVYHIEKEEIGAAQDKFSFQKEERQKRIFAGDDSSDEASDAFKDKEASTKKLRSISGDDLGNSFPQDAILRSEHDNDLESDDDDAASEDSEDDEDGNQDDKTQSLKVWEQSDDNNGKVIQKMEEVKMKKKKKKKMISAFMWR